MSIPPAQNNTINLSYRAPIDSARHVSEEEFFSQLDTAEIGEGWTRGDYVNLGLLGIALPIVLLVWGWL